ncbi:MAG: hypothetical protein QM820_52665 [Minicystis sp.]
MAVPTLDIDQPPEDVLDEHVHSLTTVEADDFASVHAPRFDALVNEWLSLNAARVQLLIAVGRAVAKAYAIDAKLDVVVVALIAALDKLTDKDRSDPLWFVYFNGEDTWSFKRPVLQGQLAKMAVWPDSLAKSPHQALVDINATLGPLLSQGETADKEVRAAKQALVDFKNVGAWRQYIDKSNAERTAIYGHLRDVPHQHPEAKLGADYAELFFLHDTSRRGAGKPKSSEEIGQELKALEGKVELLKQQQAEAKQREEKEAAARAERERKEKELAALKQQDKETKAKKKELEKELGKKKKK